MDNGISKVNSFDFSSIGLTPPQEKKSQEEMGADQFNTLLVAQLRNQNPLEPQSNTEFITQIAQFGILDSVQAQEKSFANFAAAFQSDKALQASALVGRTVTVPGNSGVLTENGQMEFGATLPVSVPDLKVSIYTEQGELVKAFPVGLQPAGEFKYLWDGTVEGGGRAPAGVYQVAIEGTVGDKMVQMPGTVTNRVDSVVLGNGQQGLTLNLPGVGQVPLSDVIEIKE
jgi:flagellar basal-body rod modification protein FlgD